MEIGFGGGCHWCTEAVFQSLRGILSVQQGYIASHKPFDDYSEAVLIQFDPEYIDIKDLIEIHLRTHASTSAHKMRGKYRSAIYIMDNEFKYYQDILSTLQGYFDNMIITQILSFASFKESDARFQNYYNDGLDKPFCKNYIDPKLTLLRQKFSSHYQRD